jgi:hypothetical protein
MLYINKGVENTLVLNINNNSRDVFDTYELHFTHIMSSEKKVYTIDIYDPLQYTANSRYCSIVLPLNTDDLNYLGQYNLNIFGDGTNLVFTSMAELEGPQEEPLFREYISPNENNENYIYIED